jgi:hypothetical protein
MACSTSQEPNREHPELITALTTAGQVTEYLGDFLQYFRDDVEMSGAPLFRLQPSPSK